MSSITNQIATIGEGSTFKYEDLGIGRGQYQAAAKTLSRMVKRGALRRATTGVFYKPRATIFGELRPSDDQLLKIYLFRNGERVAYVTGLALYNRLGLSTQVPMAIRVANRDGNIRTKIGNLKILPARSYVDVSEGNYKKLELLDALKDFRKIPDLDKKNSIAYFAARIAELSASEIQELVAIALKYPPRARAFLGAMLSEDEAAPLMASLNPLSVFKLGIGENELPNAAKWNIE